MQRIAHDHLGAPHPRQPRTTAGTIGSSRQQASSPETQLTTPTGQPAPPGLSVVSPHPTPGLGRRQTSSSSPLSNRFQLCTAYSHARQHADQHAIDNAFRKLEKAAGGAQNVSAYCAPVLAPSTANSAATPNPEPHDPTHPEHPPVTTVPPDQQGQQTG
jgi:hypothetical protein